MGGRRQSLLDELQMAEASTDAFVDTAILTKTLQRVSREEHIKRIKEELARSTCCALTIGPVSDPPSRWQLRPALQWTAHRRNPANLLAMERMAR